MNRRQKIAAQVSFCLLLWQSSPWRLTMTLESSPSFAVGTTPSPEWLVDLRWPGLFIPDGGDSGAFCGLAKRWTHAK
jgi:hypothetical protein